MSSTEFTVGIGNEMRNTSKVLKPPGGGASDIFNLGTSTFNDTHKEQPKSVDTQERIFGSPNVSSLYPKPNRMQSNIFQTVDDQPVKRNVKKCVHRNPITGEEIEINLYQENTETNNEKNCEDEKSNEIQDKPQITTSIRVRNPPGGKSSGIF